MTRDAEHALVLRVWMHEPRYHGRPEWPPSPARLFQALVAGVGRGRGLSREDTEALTWLERLPAPTIGAPRSKLADETVAWVPNNDLDARGGDPSQVAHIRAGKRIQPRLLEPQQPFVYSWPLGEDAEDRGMANRVCSIAEHLYQFGRGVDMAWATAAVLPTGAAQSELDVLGCEVFRPSAGARAYALACPTPGSLARLVERFSAMSQQFTAIGRGKNRVQVFAQPPMVLFRQVQYGGADEQHVLELQATQGRLAAWPLHRAHELVTSIRDATASRLREGLPGQEDTITDAIVGRPPGESSRIEPDQRVRFIPLPSIGSEHADRGVRRVLVAIPHASPLRSDDVMWALSGLEVTALGATLVPASDLRMLHHYGVGGGSSNANRTWRTVTAAALPAVASRRRIEPARQAEEAKPAAERADEERAAIQSVRDALRHAGVRVPVTAISVQREPFGRRGARAEDFAAGSRFPKERMWHVELKVAGPVDGPLVLGDGRYVGFGLFRPVRVTPLVVALEVVSGLEVTADPLGVSEALRRAVMARYQEFDASGDHNVPALVSGHESGGAPSRDCPRVGFAHDQKRRRLLIAVPREAHPDEVRTLMRALTGLSELRAGGAGVLALAPLPVDAERDPVLAPAATWRSFTRYTVNRHQRLGDARRAVAEDVRHACRQLGLPKLKRIEVAEPRPRGGAGLSAHVELEFQQEVDGPLLLGRSRFRGGGWFEHADT